MAHESNCKAPQLRAEGFGLRFVCRLPSDLTCGYSRPKGKGFFVSSTSQITIQQFLGYSSRAAFNSCTAHPKTPATGSVSNGGRTQRNLPTSFRGGLEFSLGAMGERLVGVFEESRLEVRDVESLCLTEIAQVLRFGFVGHRRS